MSLLGEGSPVTVGLRLETLNVDFLIDSLAKVGREEYVGMVEAIAWLVLRALIEQQQEEKQTNLSIQLMTRHAAKGFEFPHLYMIGAEADKAFVRERDMETLVGLKDLLA